MRKVRIGIDVGGTFTDAVALDGENFQIIGQAKVPTTHQAVNGVAEGIVQVLTKLLQEQNIAPEEVMFIAHGTTQATNALLEGDVAKAAILALGSGLLTDAISKQSKLAPLELAPGKYLTTQQAYFDLQEKDVLLKIEKTLQKFKAQGVEVVVITEAFGVDNGNNEDLVAALARKLGLLATTGHEVSRLYGLQTRTRTAVVNGSLIPKMLETARMTQSCVEQAGIAAPLMIMRCDGGVMTAKDMETRPILTLLSGLAAGVAGALMYEKVATGIFLEAGGTSTDISAIKDGKVMVRTAEVGGQKLYLSALDVRTRGIAGGSMVRVQQGKIVGVGPRSAHIAALDYECFSPVLEQPQLEFLAPCAGDEADYVVIRGRDERQAALTLAGAANVLGCVPAGDYAQGDVEAAQVAWQALADYLHQSVQATAQQALDAAVRVLEPVLRSLQSTYQLQYLELIGGGGSAGVIVPYLAEKLHLPWRLAENAPIISTIGVALAMSREVVERTIAHPGEDDIKAVRREALEKLLQSGNKVTQTEVVVEIDKKQNILRAIATGTQDTRAQGSTNISEKELLDQAVNILHLPAVQVEKLGTVGRFHFYAGKTAVKHWFYAQTSYIICVLERTGALKLQRQCQGVIFCSKAELKVKVELLLSELTEYGTVGARLPLLYLYYGEQQLDLTGMLEAQQLLAVAELELADYPQDEKIALVAIV